VREGGKAAGRAVASGMHALSFRSAVRNRRRPETPVTPWGRRFAEGMAGSIGYAERLSWRDDVGGTLGTPELTEADDAQLQTKIDLLTQFLREAREEHGGCVVHTGAGISTSIGIPDFRGPHGVWTAQKHNRPMPKASCSLDTAVPSLTHMALVELRNRGYVKYLVSCNVDCLHVRSGFPRAQIAELHGNCFAERCERCETEYVRDFEMQTVGFQYTGRRCARCAAELGKRKADGRRVSARGANQNFGRLRDQVLDWDDALPAKELRFAEKHSRETSLALVLGSSLQIAPSCDIPLKTVTARSVGGTSTRKNRNPNPNPNRNPKKSGSGKLVIVNLQATPKDSRASVLIRAKTDIVMLGVARRLGLRVPVYERTDSAVVGHRDVGNGFVVRVGSKHGWGNPVPWLANVDATFIFEGSRDEPAKPARGSREGEGDGTLNPRNPKPGGGGGFTFASARASEVRGARLNLPRYPIAVRLALTFAEACTERGAVIEAHALVRGDADETVEGETWRETMYSFRTTLVEYDSPRSGFEEEPKPT